MLTKQVTKSLREPTRFPVGPPRTEGAPLTAERPSICSQPSHPTITHGELGSATPVLPANNYGQTPPGCCLKKEVVLWTLEQGARLRLDSWGTKSQGRHKPTTPPSRQQAKVFHDASENKKKEKAFKWRKGMPCRLHP